MIENRYAIVKGSLEENDIELKRFAVWHTNYDYAKKEAERLCQKDPGQFIVLKAISACKIGRMPVEWEE